MKILQDTLLRDRYDVIVIGAGLGGMTAASLLAKRGLAVLMIDQQNKPGGSCTSFKRDGVVFDVGTAMLYGFGEKGFKPFRFVLNELEEPVDIVAHPTLARMTIEGKELIFWPDVDRFLEELFRLFPEEKQGIRAFYADLYKMYENIVIKNEVVVPPSEFSPRQGLRRLLSDPLAIIKMQKLLTISVKDLLDRYFHSEAIIDFYDKLCSAYCYCTAEETPAVLAATMFLDNHIGGVYYPAGGAQMLPNKIEKAFESYGGQVLYRRLVDEILIRDGMAYGVRLEDGMEVLAGQVIANATVWNIYGKLVRPEHIAPERLAWAKALVPTYPSMTLYMVVDAEALPAGRLPWEIFIENREVIDSSDLTLYINSLVDLTLGPPGKLVITAIAPNMCQWPSPQDAAYQSGAYQALKEQEAGRMIDQIEQHYPGFRQHIRTLIVGTPSTVERYLLKNGGAVGGPKNMLGQQMLNRLHARSEWKHLYFCGDSTVMATGAPATVVSGVGAANMVLRDLHQPEYDTRKFPEKFIHFVALPYQHPAYHAGGEITAQNAHLAAAECQWCESPACTASCPAGIDVPGFLRRMEAQNYNGAAHLIHERNPLAEVCGYTCAADPPCEAACYRIQFTGMPVRITELQRWVCEAAGESGWIRPDNMQPGKRVAVAGSGPSGLSCTYYLALMGCQVDIYDRSNDPGKGLIQALGNASVPQTTLKRDLNGIMLNNVAFHAGWKPGSAVDLVQWLSAYDAIYLADGLAGIPPEELSPILGQYWLAGIEPSTGQVAGRPEIFVGGILSPDQPSVVQAAASGRRAAIAISQYITKK